MLYRAKLYAPHLSNYSGAAAGRTFPSAAGFHTSNTFFTDDEGVYLLDNRDAPACADRAPGGSFDFEAADSGKIRSAAPVHSEEFKECVALQEAASSGQKATLLNLRFDVLVQAKEVLRVVLLFDGHEPVVVRTERGFDRIFSLLT
jgi:hypothetical protein